MTSTKAQASTTSQRSLIGSMLVAVLVGAPLVFYLWGTVNQLLLGQFDGLRLAVSVPVLLVFVLVLRALASRVAVWEADTDPEHAVVGTVFLVIVFLMALAGMWAIMYLDLLER